MHIALIFRAVCEPSSHLVSGSRNGANNSVRGAESRTRDYCSRRSNTCEQRYSTQRLQLRRSLQRFEGGQSGEFGCG